MSVVLSDTHAACGGVASDLIDPKYPKIAAVTVLDATQLGQLVERSPEDEDDGCDAHGGVVGEKPPEVMQGFVDVLTIAAP